MINAIPLVGGVDLLAVTRASDGGVRIAALAKAAIINLLRSVTIPTLIHTEG